MSILDLTGKDVGRYHILELLGEGGMATVYKAYDSHLDREVAMKFIRFGVIEEQYTQDMLKRFERESRALAKLSHPNIVKVYDYGEFEGAPFLVMEYLAGGTLKPLTGKPMYYAEAARLVIPIARALDYAHHQRIVHRDVKPTNILMTATGDPMLSDFGIAKLLYIGEGMTLTGPGTSVGTPEYTAPEQSTGKIVDYRADIYSLGVVFYELVTGQKPFTADTPVAVMVKHVLEIPPQPKSFISDLPDEVEEVIAKAMAKDPEERYQNMKAFVADLEKLTRLEYINNGKAASREADSHLAAPVTPSLPPSIQAEAKAHTIPSPPPVPAPEAEIAATIQPFAVLPVETPPQTPKPEAVKAPPPPEEATIEAVPRPEPVEEEGETIAASVAPPAPQAKAPTSETPPEQVETMDVILPVGMAVAETVESGALPLEQPPVEARPPSSQPETAAPAMPVKAREPVPQPQPVTPQPTPVPAEQKQPRPLWVWAVIALVALCGLSVGGWLILRGMRMSTASATPTAGVQTPVANVVASAAPAVTASSVALTLNPETAAPIEEQATAPVIISKSGNTLLFGPQHGEWAHQPGGKVLQQSAAVNLRDFTTQALLYNPFSTSAGNWDVGFFFRSSGEDNGYRLVFRSDSTWQLILFQPDRQEVVDKGVLQNLVLNNTAGKTNRIVLTVVGDWGVVFINESFVSRLNLSALQKSGDVSIETGYFEGAQKEGETTRYDEFSVWSIGSGIQIGSGELEYEEGKITTHPAEVSLDNFIARAVFKNPYAAHIGPWTIGFIFRSADENDEYRLIFTSKAQWELADKTPRLNDANTVTKSKVERIFQNGEKEQNDITLIGMKDKGFLFVNNVFIKSLDLSKRTSAGDIAVATGFYKNSGLAGRALSFEDFTVWELPQSQAVEDVYEQATQTAVAYTQNVTPTPTPPPAQAELIPPQKVVTSETGDLPHSKDGAVLQKAAGVNLSDFSVDITFNTPYAEALGVWDVGFLFRAPSNEEGYRLVIHSDNTWQLINQSDGKSVVVDDNKKHKAAIRTLINTTGSPNKLSLIALAEKGFFFINDAFVADLDLSARQEPGEIYFESGYSPGSQEEGYSTLYKDFSVWQLGQPGLGPMEGSLPHSTDGLTQTRSAGTSVKNFITRARFANPYESLRGQWDIGFAFRSAADDDQYQAVVVSGPGGSVWYFGNRQPALSATTWTNKQQKLPVSIKIGYPAENDLYLLVRENKGFFFINNTLIAPLDLVGRENAGDVAVGTGFFKESSIKDKLTRYSGFTIWELP